MKGAREGGRLDGCRMGGREGERVRGWEDVAVGGREDGRVRGERVRGNKGGLELGQKKETQTRRDGRRGRVG